MTVFLFAVALIHGQVRWIASPMPSMQACVAELPSAQKKDLKARVMCVELPDYTKS